MLNILLFLLNLIDKNTIWLYLGCLGVILFHLRSYTLARNDRVNTIFTIEREVAAHREGRAMSSIGAVLGIVVVITALKYYLVPTIDVQGLVEPTPTIPSMFLTRIPEGGDPAEPTPTEEPPTPTPRPRPTRRPPVAPTVTPTVTPAPPPCADPGTQITWPGMGATLSGSIEIRGIANHARFQFFKIELGPGAEPSGWHVINDVHRERVDIEGHLETFNTTSVPNGDYWLKLTVVDNTGNFPEPCRVRVNVSN